MSVKLGTDTIRCKNCGTLNTSQTPTCIHCGENPFNEPVSLHTKEEKKGWRIIKNIERRN